MTSEPGTGSPDTGAGYPAPLTGRAGARRVRAGTGQRRQRAVALLAPGVLYLLVREVGLLVLQQMGSHSGRSMAQLLSAWDGNWYLGIAANGYSRVPAGLLDGHGSRSAETPLAFFPGYPFLVHVVAVLPGLSLLGAAIAISMVSGVLGSYALVSIGEQVRGGSRRVGLILVALFASSPMAISESMAYTESLFCALAAASLACLLRRRWVLAGFCAALAGLLRITGGALVLAVCLAALVAILRRQDSWRPWVGGLLAPLGLAGYLGWVGYRTGSLTGYFQLQNRGWNDRFDGGATTWRFITQQLAQPGQLMLVVTLAALLAALVLLGVCLALRISPPLVIYGAAVVVMDIGSNGLMNAKTRLLLPAFVLLLPIAIGLAKRRAATIICFLAGAAVASAWFGGYALTIWPYAI
ncbi:MAG: hypothetical protein ACRDRL_04995 [Sciscionella sp.]